MIPDPLGCGALDGTAEYERLRRSALARAEGTAGVALLLRQGIGSWLRAVGGPPAQAPPRRSRGTGGRTGPVLPALIGILTDAVLQAAADGPRGGSR